MAYSDFLGTQTNNFAEVFAAIRGLEICLEYGYMNVWLEMVAITLVSGTSSGNWQLSNLQIKARQLMQQLNVQISPIFREGNKVADHLANLACDLRTNSIF